MAVILDLRGIAQGALDVLNVVPHGERGHEGRGLSDDLVDDRHGPLFPVGIHDGQRYPLSPLVHLENEKLARPALPGDLRGLQIHPDHAFR